MEQFTYTDRPMFYIVFCALDFKNTQFMVPPPLPGRWLLSYAWILMYCMGNVIVRVAHGPTPTALRLTPRRQGAATRG